MAVLRLGICGWGTVAQAFYQLWRERAEEIERRFGVRIEIVAMSTRRLPKGLDLRQCDTVLDIPKLSDIDAVVELIGGTDTAADIAHATLAAGKHLITANKALLAERGEELGAVARERGLRIGAEAAVGGAIPLLRALRTSFGSDEVHGIYGILNGNLQLHTESDGGGAGLRRRPRRGAAVGLRRGRSDPRHRWLGCRAKTGHSVQSGIRNTCAAVLCGQGRAARVGAL